MNSAWQASGSGELALLTRAGKIDNFLSMQTSWIYRMGYFPLALGGAFFFVSLAFCAMAAVSGEAKRYPDKPMRIIVRNTGGALLFLAHDASTLVVDGSAGVQGTFQLPVGDSEVFVLAPKQGIYAIAFGNGGQVSMAVSEAVPTVWMES